MTGCSSFSTSPFRGNVSDHFDGEQFHNTDSVESKNFFHLLYWFLTRTESAGPVFFASPFGEKPLEKIGNGSLRATFVNHATVLLQFDNVNILTDPVWSETVGPGTFLDPHRTRPPGIRFEDLPKIDIVLLSHNHYDHTDIPTLKRLADRFNPVMLVPLGEKALLLENGLTNAIELDWWQDTTLLKKKITLVPAHHFTMRGLEDRNTSLWGGYVVESEEGPIYFAGDTGWGDHFRKIYEKFGKMRLSLLPIGPVNPRGFMAPVHIDGVEAVKAHIVLQSQTSMAIHHGTYQQGDDTMLEPLEVLMREIKKKNLSKNEFRYPFNGKYIDVAPLKP
jgi:L-ascorbate metabolism protein UlaG (beta-lactamase superfamily)